MLKDIVKPGKTLHAKQQKKMNGGFGGCQFYCFCHPTKGPGPNSGCCSVN